MVWNVSEDEGPVIPESTGVVPPESTGEVQGGGTGGGTVTGNVVEQELTPQQQRMANDLLKYRGRLHDVPEARFEEVVAGLRAGKSVRSLAMKLIEEGFCAHLAPQSVRVYVTGVRDALGIPGPELEVVEQVASGDDADEPIEGQSALKRLRWMARVQQSRVRKALTMEGMMGGMIMPLASNEMKLMLDLVKEELAVALKVGEMKTVPETVKVETPAVDTIVKTPAEAFAVILAYRRLLKMREQVLAAEKAIDDPASGN